MNGYRLAIGGLVGVLFVAQCPVRQALTGSNRCAVGYLVSVGFIVALAEFATLTVGRRLVRPSARPCEAESGASGCSTSSWSPRCSCSWTSARRRSALTFLSHRPPPTILLVIVVGFWFVMIGRAACPGVAASSCFIGLIGLVLGSRLLVLAVTRLDPLTSDMLPTIDRALDELLDGRFPYVNFPPPMPYLPGMFLAYLPPKLLGVDLRLTNLVLDVATAAIAIGYFPGARRHAGSSGRPDGRWVRVEQVALPLSMLHPTWINSSLNSQFAPSVLTTVLLGRAIIGAPAVQAMALGVAVGSSQMLVATGPIVFACWLREHGWRRALRLSVLAMAVVLAIIAPFLIWNPRQFLGIAFGSRRALPVEVMSGRLTIFPLFLGVLPRVNLILTALVIGVGAIAAWRSRRPEAVVAAMAPGLFAACSSSPSASRTTSCRPSRWPPSRRHTDVPGP